MTDRYIDAEETQVYGPHTASALRDTVRGRVPEMDGAVEYMAAALTSATTVVGTLLGTVRGTDSARRGATADATPLLDEAHTFLVNFSSLLDAHPAVDRHLFFTHDGTVRGVGRAAPKVLLAVQHIGIQLGGVTAIPDAATWQRQAQDLATRLAPALATSGTTRKTRHEQTPELVHARAAWLTTYAAAKSLVDSVLRISGHLELVRDVFYDLQLPSGVRAVDAPPPAPTPAPAAGGAAAGTA